MCAAIDFFTTGSPGTNSADDKLLEQQELSFDNINNISSDITLVKLVDILGNVNNVVSITGIWIYD